MNERIKQLLNEATSRHVQETDRSKVMTVSAGEMITFAELIVAECVGVVEKLSPGYKDYRDQIEDAFRRDCMEEIKQHFGVE